MYVIRMNHKNRPVATIELATGKEVIAHMWLADFRRCFESTNAGEFAFLLTKRLTTEETIDDTGW